MASISFAVLSADGTGLESSAVEGTTAPVANSRCSFSYDRTLYRDRGQIIHDIDNIRRRILDGDFNYEANTSGSLTGTI